MDKGIKMIPRKYLFNTKVVSDGRIEEQRHKAYRKQMEKWQMQIPASSATTIV